MIDKYEAHNQKVFAAHKPGDFLVVLNKQFYDVCEKEGRLDMLDQAIISVPVSAMVQYPRAKGRNNYQPLRIGKRRIIRKK